MTEIAPVVVPESELRLWEGASSGLFEVGRLLSRYAPRGKGWFPRQVGKTFGRGARAVMTTACGARLAVDFDNLEVYTTMANLAGPSEEDVLVASHAVLNPGDTFFDVGANAGYVSVELARLLGGRLRCVAFEPQASLARAAAVSAALNGFGDFAVYVTMVGAKSGEGVLFIPGGAAQASAVARSPHDQPVRAPMITLDNFVTRTGAKPDLIKIDVEGAELDVLRGAERTLRALRPYVIFETFDENLTRWGYGRGDLMRYLEELAGYSFFALWADRMAPENPGGPYSDTVNYLAAPPGRPAPRPVQRLCR